MEQDDVLPSKNQVLLLSSLAWPDHFKKGSGSAVSLELCSDTSGGFRGGARGL